MKLIEWMKKERYRITELAELARVDKSIITMHINHGKRFGRRRAERVEKATGGKVTALELMFPELEVRVLKKGKTNKTDKKEKTNTQSNDAIAC